MLPNAADAHSRHLVGLGPGWVKVKKILGCTVFSRITFEPRKISNSFKHNRVSLSPKRIGTCIFSSEGQVENLTSGQSNTMIDLS